MGNTSANQSMFAQQTSKHVRSETRTFFYGNQHLGFMETPTFLWKHPRFLVLSSPCPKCLFWRAQNAQYLSKSKHVRSETGTSKQALFKIFEHLSKKNGAPTLSPKSESGLRVGPPFFLESPKVPVLESPKCAIPQQTKACSLSKLQSMFAPKHAHFFMEISTLDLWKHPLFYGNTHVFWYSAPLVQSASFGEPEMGNTSANKTMFTPKHTHFLALSSTCPKCLFRSEHGQRLSK